MFLHFSLSFMVCSAVDDALQSVALVTRVAKEHMTLAKPQKKFALPADRIRPLVEGRGGCFATDMITVEGLKVGYMYREEPDFEIDSGWRFMSGRESQAYIDDAANLAIYDVNTIANYDPDIIPFLDAPVGAAFERQDGTGPFVAIEGD